MSKGKNFNSEKMKKLFTIALCMALHFAAIAQSDTIWKGDTMIVLFHDNEVPDYAKLFAGCDYAGTILSMVVTQTDEYQLPYLVWSMKAMKESAGMKNLLPSLTGNPEFYWVFADPKVRALVGEANFRNDSVLAAQHLKKMYPNADFSYFSTLSFCDVRTSIYRNLYNYFRTDIEIIQAMDNNQYLLDSLNLVTIDSLIQIYGLPDTSKVTTQGVHMFFICVQHFDKESFLSYRKVMTRLYREKQLSLIDYAYYLDRYMVYKGRKQVYGTQLRRNNDGQLEFYPIRCEKRVNNRRKKAGFEETAEDYLKMVSF